MVRGEGTGEIVKEMGHRGAEGDADGWGVVVAVVVSVNSSPETMLSKN